MNLEEREAYAVKLHMDGYNCAQAIIGSYSDVIGLSFDDAMKLTYGMGAGMGKMREACGTVIGAGLVLSYYYGQAKPDADKKAEVYGIVNRFDKEFKENHEGKITCRDLLNLESDESDYLNKPFCNILIKDVVKQLDDYLK